MIYHRMTKKSALEVPIIEESTFTELLRISESVVADQRATKD